jgi:hypothetical protein
MFAATSKVYMAQARKKSNQLLAESLTAAKAAARDNVIKSTELQRGHRERLIKANCLTEVIRGWYLFTSPDGGNGSTAWYGGIWGFLKHYLDDRFGKGRYCLSAESSVSLHAGDTTIPTQIVILTKKESNTTIELLHKTSIFLRTDIKNFPKEIENYNGIPIMSLPSALCRLAPAYFANFPRNVEIVMKMATLSVADISGLILKNESITAAERIIGAYQFLKEESKGDQIFKDLTAAGYDIKPQNPFNKYQPQLGPLRLTSPHAGRIRILWNSMREKIISIMPLAPGIGGDQTKTIDVIRETYVQDAYNSLSIEGYQVTEELISKIENGSWDPENVESDRIQKDALAAKGYRNSYEAVMNSIAKVLKGTNPGSVLEEDLQDWYRELFAPLLRANLESPEKIAGFRRGQVYISNSRHVPPPRHSVLDCMDVFFELLRNETNPAVKVVLGHFIFVYIHPYMDGNGRIGRFIMNLMLVSGGYNWTIIRLEKRSDYMAALEKASVDEDIEPFARFLKEEMEFWKIKLT